MDSKYRLILFILLFPFMGKAQSLAPKPSPATQGATNTLSTFNGGLQSTIYFRPPRGFHCWVQQDSAGMFWFDSGGTNTMYYHNGTTRVQIGAGGGGSGTVTSITAGTGLTGGTITTSGTIRLDTTFAATQSDLNTVADNAFSDLADTAAAIRGAGYATTSAVADSVSGRMKYSDTVSLSNRINSKGTGSVTSAAIANAFGISFTGSPITTTGTFTPTVDTSKIASVASVNVKQNYSDTLTWDATRSWTNTAISGKMNYTDTVSLSNRINTKQNFSDTTTWDATRSWVIGQIPSVTGYVPYTGATDSVRLGEYPIRAGQYNLDLTPTAPQVVGGMYWDATNVCPSMPLNADVSLQIGQEVYVRGRNNTGVTISNGTVVYINSAQGNNPTIAKADADAVNTSQVIGVATEDIGINATGFVTVTGVVNGVNTSGYSSGDALYLDTIAGGLTNQLLPSPHNVVFVGYALNRTNNGRIFVRPSSPISADTTMAANGNQIAPTQVAVKSYVNKRQLYSDTSTFDATRAWVNGRGFGTGSVTSVGSGFGLSGGTITSSGTLAVDTSGQIATVAGINTAVATKQNITDTSTWDATIADLNAIAIDTTALSRRISLLNTIQGANIASADTINLLTATGNYVNVTGTTTIRGLSPTASGNAALIGARRVVQFTGALTLTYNATTLILPGSANITTVAGDVVEFVYEGGVSWRCINYAKRTWTGTGGMMLAASPTTTGTLTAAAITASGTLTANGTLTLTGPTTASTAAFATGANASTVLKTVNIGTGGAAGSTTNINIAPSATGALGTTTINGLLVTGVQTYTATATNVNAVSITPTYNQASGAAVNTDLLINRTQTAVGSGTQRLISAQVAGSELFGVSNTGAIILPTRTGGAASYTTSVTISADSVDNFVITAQAGALLFNAPSGTPRQMQQLIIRIKDNGTARALTWNAIWRSGDVTLPTTTTLGKTLYMQFVYNSTDTKWDIVGKSDSY